MWKNIIKTRRGIDFPAFKQSIIEAAESFPVDTTINFTIGNEEMRTFLERAQGIYANLTSVGKGSMHARRIFDPYGIKGRMKPIKSILQNNGWDLVHHKSMIFNKVV
jgi:hypothetical protein